MSDNDDMALGQGPQTALQYIRSHSTTALMLVVGRKHGRNAREPLVERLQLCPLEGAALAGPHDVASKLSTTQGGSFEHKNWTQSLVDPRDRLHDQHCNPLICCDSVSMGTRKLFVSSVSHLSRRSRVDFASL